MLPSVTPTRMIAPQDRKKTVSNRYVPLISGVVAMGLAAWVAFSFDAWWKYLVGGLLLFIGWQFLRIGLFATHKQIHELTTPGPVSRDTERFLNESVAGRVRDESQGALDDKSEISLPTAADPYYAEIREDQIGLYQKYLDGLFAVIDIDNYTSWSMSKEYDKERMKRDDRLMQRVCCEEAAADSLSPSMLQVMIHQYFFADPWLRERYQSTWVETVVYDEEELSFFPGAQNVRGLMEAVFH